ncbi:MAG: carboxypeptidase-like regulatory domain-containing protein [Pseudomonadota bacterium]
MNAPTGGPNGSGFGFRPACALSGLCAVLYYLLAANPASAQTQLRVTGTLTIEANASLRRGACDVRARVLDDAGQPVSAGQLQIKPLSSPAGSSVHECGQHPSELSANAAGAYLASTSDAGTVCVHFEGVPEHAEFELTFSDPNGLYAAANKHVIADSATRSVEMAFAPGQTVLALERDTQILSLVTRPEPPLAIDEKVQNVELALNLAHEGRAAEKLASALVEIGSNAEFRVPSRAFGEPGPLEIIAEFAGSASTRAARALLHVTSTAQARVTLAEPLAASHPESGVRVRVRVSSVAGAVPSGSVEARSGGISLGSARVSNGTAELYVQLEEAAAKARPLELRYVADTPWWLPGQPLSVAVPILPPSPWRRLAWVAAALALGAWLLVGWQRPRRLERAAHARAQRDSARAPIDVLELGHARSGWRGRVLDAHDGSPIANALVLMRMPSFDASGVQHTARTDDDGAFALEGSAGPGAALTVRAPFHSPLAAPMPPPGTLVLSLTSRRRTLLTRFVDWATREGRWDRRGEVTPGEVARRTDRTEVAGWAGAVDEAAFGPEPLSESKEQGLLAREPSHDRKPC